MKKPVIVLLVVVVLGFVLFGTGIGCQRTPQPTSAVESQAQKETESTVESTVAEESAVVESTTLETESAEAVEAPDLDITGCDTFTQIVDKLEPGMGYVNVKIGDEDVLLVCSGAFDNGDGLMAAIDATIFRYENGAPKQIGKVTCGGTAYPLALKDGILYSAGNHFVQKSIVEDGRFQLYETGWEEFDTDGNATYYYESSEGKDESSKESLDRFFEEYGQAEVIGFDVIAVSTIED